MHLLLKNISLFFSFKCHNINLKQTLNFWTQDLTRGEGLKDLFTACTNEYWPSCGGWSKVVFTGEDIYIRGDLVNVLIKMLIWFLIFTCFFFPWFWREGRTIQGGKWFSDYFLDQLVESLDVSEFRGCILWRQNFKGDYVTAMHWRLSKLEGSFSCGQQMCPPFVLIWEMGQLHPSQSSQDTLQHGLN